MPLALATLLTAASLAAGLGPPPPLALPGRQSAEAWSWPLAGTPVVVRPFVPPATPWGAGHRGVDLAATPGATVLAAGPGVVSFAGYVAGVGVVSIVHSGGLRTTYEPVAPLVTVGAAMSLGEPIGHLQPGHGDCGPGRWCLHWGLLRGSAYLDPLTLIHRGPVRLLPLSAGAALDPGRPSAALSLSLALADPPGAGRLAAGSPQHPPIGATTVAAAPPRSGRTPPGGQQPPATDRRSPAAGRRGLTVEVATAATGTATAAALAWSVRAARKRRMAALVWSVRAARKRRMAAHRGRHRGVSRGRAPELPAAGLSRAGRRAWP